MAHARRWSALGLPVVILLIAALTVSIRAAAQDASHPAHIHQGTCDNLGDIVEPLDNVSVGEASEVSGTENPIEVRLSETLVPLSLDDILGGEHSINVHESDDNIQAYSACGEIGGPVRGGKLVIGLGELNQSDHSGVAVLEEAEGGTNVTIYLIEQVDAEETGAAADGGDEATVEAEAPAAPTTAPAAEPTTAPAAAPTTAPAAEPTEEPAAQAPAGNQVAVDIVNFTFDPNPITIAVGDTITWTNQDGVPHTATGQNRDLLQSGTIPPGGTFSQTFSEAGEIPYFCEFHPNMNGTVIVQ